jgi:hypothetical protein
MLGYSVAAMGLASTAGGCPDYRRRGGPMQGRPAWQFRAAPGTVCRLIIDRDLEVVSDRSNDKTGGGQDGNNKPRGAKPDPGMETQ